MDLFLSLSTYVLTGVVAAILVGVIVVSARHRRDPDKGFFNASSISAGGGLFALVAGLVCAIVLRHSPLLQQARFISFYMGFSLLLIGNSALIRHVTHLAVGRAYAAVHTTALLVSCYFLFNANKFVLGADGYQIPLKIYWLPPFVVTVVGTGLFTWLINKGYRSLRYASIYNLLLVLALLRLSSIMPSINPVVDGLEVFVPLLAAAGFGLASIMDRASRNVASKTTH